MIKFGDPIDIGYQKYFCMRYDFDCCALKTARKHAEMFVVIKWPIIIFAIIILVISNNNYVQYYYLQHEVSGVGVCPHFNTVTPSYCYVYVEICR